MAFKIDGLTYPDVGIDMLKHTTLGPILRSVMRAGLQQENYMFLDAVAKGESYSSLFNGFISEKARREINLPARIKSPMQQAGDMGNFYDKKIWEKGIKDAAAEINTLIRINITSVHLKENKAFRAHHSARMWKNRASFYRQWKKSQEMKKVEKFLGETHDMIGRTAVLEAYAALKYKPKASKKPIDEIATASGKKPKDVEKMFKRIFKLK